MNPIQETIEQTRREFLTTSFSGVGTVALTSLLAQSGALSAGAPVKAGGALVNPLAPRSPHFKAPAKSCIFIFMAGAPSHLDLFNYRPVLEKLDGEKMPEELLKEMRFAFIQRDNARLMGSQYKFRQHGQSGMWMSELLPQISTCADDICLVNSMQTEQFNHHPGQLMMQCGGAEFGLPSMGSWISYGLGTENRNLPSYIVLTAGRGSSGGSTLWQSGFLPSIFEGVPLRSQGEPILNLANPEGLPGRLQRRSLDALGELNRENYNRMHDPEIQSRIANYELAFRMQAAAPELANLSGESAATLEAYGVDREGPKLKSNRGGDPKQYGSFATNCLLARRMVERGVRFVNIIHASWDHHSKIDPELGWNAGMADQPIAALIKDLKSRGLLDSTMVVWGSEFGRTPLGENRPGYKKVTGRDHHPKAFSMFVAGGGFKGGTTHGVTDDIGWDVAENPVHVNDFQATLLKQFGLDHLRLTFRHQGADKRLTNLTRESRVVDEIIS